MRKCLFLLLFVLLFTGCDIKEVNDKNLDDTIDLIIENNKFVNTVSRGYKYYLPNGVTLVNSDNYNEKLSYNGDFYYLYIDIVKHYYKNNEDYKEGEDSYYYKPLNGKEKKGYINVKKVEDLYFIDAVYNYFRIEAYVTEQNLRSSILNIGYILSSVKLNDVVTELLLDDNKVTGKEEKFSLYKDVGNKDSFYEYLEMYDKYSEEVVIEDQNISGNIGKESE